MRSVCKKICLTWECNTYDMKKTVLIAVITIMVIMAGCNGKSSTPSFQEAEINAPDTIWLPGGLYDGMTESELLKHIKNNPKVFYKDNKEVLKFVHMKIAKVDYAVSISLYRGRIRSVLYMGNQKAKTIDDTGLKEHFKAVCALIENINKYHDISNEYEQMYREPWPFSIGYTDEEFIMKYRLSSDLFSEYYLVGISSFKGKLSVNITYNGKHEGGFEPSLSSGFYLD